MNEYRTMGLVVALLGTLLAGPGCNEDEAGADGEQGTTDGTEAMCDPEGVDAQMGALLNAPVGPDVEAIVKVPQHPGAAGPLDLP